MLMKYRYNLHRKRPRDNKYTTESIYTFSCHVSSFRHSMQGAAHGFPDVHDSTNSRTKHTATKMRQLHHSLALRSRPMQIGSPNQSRSELAPYSSTSPSRVLPPLPSFPNPSLPLLSIPLPPTIPLPGPALKRKIQRYKIHTAD